MGCVGRTSGTRTLKPFDGGRELTDKAIEIFSIIHPQFGKNLQAMDEHNLFDLDSRKGKAPGGYNYPLEVTGILLYL